MKTKAFYTAVTTDNLEKTMEFYVVLLGFQVTHLIDSGDNRVAVLENDAGAKIDVIEAKNAPSGFCAFRTNVDDIEKAAGEFTARGYEVKGPWISPPDAPFWSKTPTVLPSTSSSTSAKKKSDRLLCQTDLGGLFLKQSQTKRIVIIALSVLFIAAGILANGFVITSGEANPVAVIEAILIIAALVSALF